MNRNKKIIIGILILVLIIVIGVVIAYKLIENNVTNREDFKFKVENISSTPIETINHEKNNENETNSNILNNTDNKVEEITWEEITADGVNEELLLKNVDEELLTQIATELQTLVDEAIAEERANPEIVITEGWTRVFKNERYKKVLNMGTPAMKPLYLIIYKSPYAGEYEYLCARILYELSGFDFYWTNSKDFLDGFNQKIIESRK